MLDRLQNQIAFILEIDKMKTILRQNVPITEPHRQENDAEHSWHLAMMALLLAEHADEPVDVARVVSMVLIHDVVEIDAGDTFIYDDKAQQDQVERENKAADRLFGMLPADQASYYRALWDEFEARVTADARFARAIDRLQPVLLNVATKGLRWRVHGVTADRVLARNKVIGDSSEKLWDYLQGLVARMVSEGYLPAGPTPAE
ncbi:HD domain-containing protein [Telmatospirillum sp.]|uniref:HD domain-containing protein n=1 Tax=Telmatospirillum sp. TaxID=2079197 RepID=UPI00284DCF0A|nr:HD domain-containing protein [Telmatospirillum sp.]MDR3436810.1 HD domain-containing protein [Telmatospirillum sp.]